VAIDKTALDDELKDLRDEDPIQVKGATPEETWQGIKTNLVNQHDVIAAGLENDYRFSVMLVISEWTNLPLEGSVVKIGTAETEYRVMRTARDSVDVGYRIDLGNKFQNKLPGPSYGGRV